MSKYKLEDFQLLKIIGEGGNAIVFAAEHNKKICVIKAVRKDRSRCSNFGITEKNVLKKIKHPFIIEFYGCFSTETWLCYILEFTPGGDFGYLLHRNNYKLPLETVQFYGAELCLAISYLHSNGILHRDIKFGNFLIAKDGHVKLTDFGSSVEQRLEGKRRSMKGTLYFMAPEVFKQEIYSYESDWWSLGVCLYVMLYGKYPVMFKPGISQKDFFKKLEEDISFPDHISATAVSFLKGLLEKDPNKRLGTGGFEEIRSHEFFANIEWEQLEKKELKPPFEPEVKSSRDFSYFDPYKVKEPHSLPNNNEMAMEPLFQDFDYVNPNWNE